MTPYEAYHYPDFTAMAYRDMLVSAKEHYTFVDLRNKDGVDGPTIINRHDIDFSVQRALSMAVIEESLGIRSVYFVNPHSEFYNPLERSLADILSKMRDLGHDIGLHFDSHYWGVTNANALDRYLSIDRDILENALGIEVTSFSFHNTTPFTMSCDADEYAGLANAYARSLFDRYKYCSDSNGYWRYDRMPSLIGSRAHPHLYLLTHPVWWTNEVLSPWEKIVRAVRGRADAGLDLYRSHLQKMGMQNIGYEDSMTDRQVGP